MNWRLFLREFMCKSLDLIHRSMSDFAIHRTANIIDEAGSILSMRASQAAGEAGASHP
jgi:hypothetical protein